MVGEGQGAVAQGVRWEVMAGGGPCGKRDVFEEIFGTQIAWRLAKISHLCCSGGMRRV